MMHPTIEVSGTVTRRVRVAMFGRWMVHPVLDATGSIGTEYVVAHASSRYTIVEGMGRNAALRVARVLAAKYDFEQPDQLDAVRDALEADIAAALAARRKG